MSNCGDMDDGDDDDDYHANDDCADDDHDDREVYDDDDGDHDAHEMMMMMAATTAPPARRIQLHVAPHLCVGTQKDPRIPPARAKLPPSSLRVASKMPPSCLLFGMLILQATLHAFLLPFWLILAPFWRHKIVEIHSKK